MTLSNFDKWRSYTAGLPSPDNFIDWAWIGVVSAALQRRVWCPPSTDPLYANTYIIFVAPPGVGKGGVIRAIGTMLSYWKRKDFKPDIHNYTPEEKYMVKIQLENDLANAQSNDKSNQKNGIYDPPLFADAPDATTYESIVQTMAGCISRKNYRKFDPDLNKEVLKIYSHSSMYFNLEELGSAFRKNHENFMNFLQQAYDCGDQYRYKTKGGGEDRITRLCLSFMAGTTPAFLETAFDDRVTNQGLASRTFYVYAPKDRKSVFFRPPMTEEQIQHKKELLEHIYKLADLYGEVQIDQETRDWLENWIHEFKNNPDKRPSRSPKLDDFIARMNIHIMKVAMCLHFGEHTTMHIPLETFKRAVDMLLKEMKNMSFALMSAERNPLNRVAKKVLAHLDAIGARTFKELCAEFYSDCKTKREMEDMLEFLETTDRIEIIDSKNNGNNEIKYKSKGKK